MKKHLLPLLALACCYGAASAQSSRGVSYFYPADISARTVAPIPGTSEFVMTETFHDPAGGQNNKIRFVHYDPLLGPDIVLNDTILGRDEFDERNVSISRNANNGSFFLVTFAQHYPSNGNSFVKVHLLSPSGSLLLSGDFNSMDPQYGSLIPLDGIYDPIANQYVVVGTALNHANNYSPAASKVAFVATLDATLAPLNIMLYDSDPNLGRALDYDMANKVIVDQMNGRYYVTGSQNVNKGGRHVMGMRNMLIDPYTLMPNPPGWDTPLMITDPGSEENSVDMVAGLDALGNRTYNVLANSTSNSAGTGKWHLYQIDPTNGLPYPGLNRAYTAFVFSDNYGHSIRAGNGPNQVVVCGMKFRAVGGCSIWDQEATPFMTSLDMGQAGVSLGSMLIDHAEYNTVMGSWPYWNLGGVYSPSNSGYPLPCYLNKFVEREGNDYSFSLAAPVIGTFGNLNTKYLRVDNNLRNGCDDILCRPGIDFNRLVQQTTSFTQYFAPNWARLGMVTDAWDDPYAYDVCEAGYYKPGATGIATGVGTKEGIEVYPNPVTSEMTLVLGDAYEGKAAQVSLYDLVGKRLAVWNKSAGEATTLRLRLESNVSPGVYMLQIAGYGHPGIVRKITVGR